MDDSGSAIQLIAMNIDEFVAVSGLSGLYKMVVNRSNGLIIENLDNGKKRFASSRKHQFTPLASIGIYTLTDTTELKEIFRRMLEQFENNPPAAIKAGPDEIISYFTKILPDYDRDRVYLSDIKRVIKWFNFLNDRNLLSLEEEQKEEEEQEAQTEEGTTETVAEETTTGTAEEEQKEESTEP
ncbi:MAG: DUF5606 domain-containing protein [Bacteroidota bacterium]